MSLTLTAYLNQRFQFPYDVTTYGFLYTNLSTAIWRLQVRPIAGSPIILLDFKTGGSTQKPGNVAIYYPESNIVSFNCPTSSLVGIQPGTYVFDFGFTLPSADFERVDGGVITFIAGQTAAGVQGSPAAPPGSDATVMMGAGSAVAQVPASILIALAAANSSALAAHKSATEAAASAAAALASFNQAQTSASFAQGQAIDAETAAAAAEASNGFRVKTETLTVTATNTLSSMTYSWTGSLSFMKAKGVFYMTTGSGSAYEISGSNVLWHPANAGGVNLNPGDEVVLVYSY